MPASDILHIAPWNNHVDIKMNTSFVSQNCGSPEDFYRLEYSEEMSSKAKFSTLLAAFMAGKKIGLSLDGCIDDRPKVVGIRFSR